MSSFPTSVRVLFVDVFDTVLTRNLHLPSHLFMRVQRRLVDLAPFSGQPWLLEEFCRSRMAAEVKAREALTDKEEVTLPEIVSALAQHLQLTPAATDAVARCELEEELYCVSPVRPVIALLQKARDDGKRVIFVSDMYLPKETVQEMLRRVGVLEEGDQIYVSSAVGKKKATGSLFKHLLQELRLQPEEVVHLGDYLLSDYLVPHFKLGIPALSVRIARANIYERLWGDSCRCLYCSSIAGASRAARVARGVEGETAIHHTLYRLGCNILGPILASFLLWTLQKAAQSGTRRLYFLSRDGEVMLEVARELAGRLGINMELRYLCVSRTAVFPALMATGVDSRKIKWLKEPTIILTVRIIADRLKVDRDTLYWELLRAGAGVDGIDAPLDAAGLESVYDLLVSDPTLTKLLADSGRRTMEDLGGYLDQEKLFDGTPCGLVDLGWHGGMQDVIHACFGDRLGANGISGYYFGVDLPGKEGSAKSGYFFDHSEGSEFHRFRVLFRVLIELLCSGSHGMVRSYGRTAEGCYIPLCDKLEDAGNWDRITSVRKGCLAFIRNLDSSSLYGFDYQHVRAKMLMVFKKLFFFPSKDEALAIGGLYFSADQTGHGLHEVAPPFTLGSAFRFLASRSYASRSRVSSWFFASWTRSNYRMRILMCPLVWGLRIWYCGADVAKLSSMGWVDTINNWINFKRSI